jgi:excisionase family DNA binding protein
MTEQTAEALTLTVTEAAHLLRLSRNTAYAAAKRGDIPTVRIGRRLLVPRAALEELLGGRRSQRVGTLELERTLGGLDSLRIGKPTP